MISIISPAKSMNFTDDLSQEIPASRCKESSQMQEVLKALQKMSVADIMSAMKVSEKIAKLNYDRFNDYDKLAEKQAIYAYDGDVYNNIDTDLFDAESREFAQEHVRILSALYGLLKPLDLIKAYRLEMSCKLDEFDQKKMHIFWQSKMTEDLNAEIASHNSKYIVNLASNEYSASIMQDDIEADMINIHFRERRNGELKNIAIMAKKARGRMADFIIRNKIDNPDDLKNFNDKGYVFDKTMSDSNNFYFVY